MAIIRYKSGFSASQRGDMLASLAGESLTEFGTCLFDTLPSHRLSTQRFSELLRWSRKIMRIKVV